MIAHNETVILVTVGAICLLSMVVVYLQVFGKKGLLETGDKPDIDFTKIEESLKKILSQTQNTIAQVSSAPAAAPNADGTPGAGASPGEVAALKAELDSRVKMIEALTKQIESVKADDGSPELMAKIKTLEGKLAEYEIIEDDIADLSHYKEENARLKKELDGIKRGGPELVDQFAAAMTTAPTTASEPASTPAPVAAAEPEPMPAPAPAAEPISTIQDVNAGQQAEDSLESALAQAQVAPAAPSPAPPGEAEILEFSNDGSAGSAAAVAPPVAAAASGVTTTPISESAAKSDPEAKADIFAEFSGAKEDNKDPLAELGDIDTNRMLEELKDLNLDMSVGAEALEEAPDIDKMADEAQTLSKKS